ncbi:MAG TPA: TonB-dependent receptor [Terriglobales bacterium]|nr:TonB-dependent receptor [Terriglobales bacterium]
MHHRIRSSVRVDCPSYIQGRPRFRFEAVVALWLGWTCLCLGQSPSPRQIRGVVEDASHATISNATVALKQGSSEFTATTGRDGTFEFRNFSNDKLEISISASGFAATRRAIPAGISDENLVIVLQPDTVNTEIEVTASRTALSLDDSPQSVQVLSPADIRTSGALEVDDVLRQVAGFDQFRRNSSRTSNPTTQGVSMRGMGSSGASRALVLLDGVPITDPFGGWVNWSQIPRESLESVEMLRGGASDLYGGEALSGVTQLLTRTQEGTDASLDLSYGNQETPNVSGYLGHSFGRWITSGAAEYFRTAGYIPVQFSQRGAVDDPANSLHRNGQLQVQRQLSQRSRFFIRGLGYDDSRHNGTIIEINRTRAWQAVTGLDLEGPSDSLLQVRGYGGTETYHQTFASIAADRNTETLARVQQVPSRQFGLSAQYSRTVGWNTLLAGGEFSHVTGESDDQVFTAGKPSSLVNAGGIIRNTGVFLEDIARIKPRWLLTGGVRFDDWRPVSGFTRTVTLPSGSTVLTPFPDRSETAWNPKLATTFRLNDRIALKASAYRSFRSPTLNELYRSFRLGNIMTTANPQLRAERLTGWELGPTEKLVNGRLNLRQGFFWATVHRPIANVTLSSTPALITRQRQNLGSTRARGVEAQADWAMMKWIEISAQYQFVDAVVTSFPADQTLVGLQVPEVPRHEFTFQARYSNPRFVTVAFQGRSNSSVFDDDRNTLTLDPYFKLDTFISRRLNSYADVYIAAENLLNDRYMVARTTVVTLASPLVARAGLQLHLRR